MERGGLPKEITYRNKGACPLKVGAFIVEECYGGIAVNEYIGYDKGGYFTLYPRRRLYSSPLELTKQNINVRSIERDY